MNLSDINGAFGQGGDSPLTDVDISPFLGKPAGSIVLKWREPSAAGIHQIAKDALGIKKIKLHWPDELCIEVATIAACHVEPTTGALPCGHFYMNRAADESEVGKKCWQFLIVSLSDAYPHLLGRTFRDRTELKNWLSGSSLSAPAGVEDATRLSLDTSPQA